MLDNTRAQRPTFVTHLECSATGETQPADQLANLSSAGKPLLVRYDLEALGKAVKKSDLLSRAPDIWRYREFLPVRRAENIVSLGESMTPLINAPRMARKIGAGELIVKDEGRMPTGSFKARGIAMAVSMAKELGVERIAMPTAGSAGASLAAYCARAGMTSYILFPDDAPSITVSEIPLYGGHGYAVNGIITDLGPIVEQGSKAMGWFNLSTLKEPYRVEGKKTMGLELAEQFEWDLPDAIFYPTGGGTGLIGMWKAFDELQAIGWIGAKRPRLVAVQSETCAPIVRAFDKGALTAEPWKDGHTSVAGVRVPFTIGDALILRTLRDTNGFGMTFADSEVDAARREIAELDGINLSIEGAATLVAARKAIAQGRVGAKDRIVLFNCANGLKYPVEYPVRHLDRHKPIAFETL